MKIKVLAIAAAVFFMGSNQPKAFVKPLLPIDGKAKLIKTLNSGKISNPLIQNPFLEKQIKSDHLDSTITQEIELYRLLDTQV